MAAGRPPAVADDAIALLESARDHRMTGLTWSAVERGDLKLPAVVRQELAGDDLRIRRHHAVLREALRDVLRVATQQRVAVLVLKGLAAQSRWYERDGERPSNDLDLLVAPADQQRVPALVRALEPDHELLPQLATLIRGRTVQSIDVLLAGPVELDLHLDPLKLAIPTRQLLPLWERRVTAELDAVGQVDMLDPSLALVHFLLHLNKDNFARLLGFADVARILASEEVEWDFVLRFVRAEGLEVPVTGALRTVSDTLGLPAPALLGATSWSGWRALRWQRLWPPDSQLEGEAGLYVDVLRSDWLPWLARGREGEAMRWWLRRKLFLPDVYVRAFYPDLRGPYLWRLVRGRIRRFRTAGIGAAGPVTTHALRRAGGYGDGRAAARSSEMAMAVPPDDDRSAPLRLRADRVTWRQVEDEVVVLDVDTSSYVGLNPSGALLWERLEEGATTEELSSVLSERFGLALDVARADVEAFVGGLRARGLLEVVS
jgi:hypothetical protein